ncbi:hypothetical protein J4G37_50575, partial [Microvirga sp. 3-52]|nr:hypothetical protein [Microvirga sp. 3-52]
MYTTDIINQDQTDFKNKATLLSNNTKVADASASVQVKRGTPLAKRSAHYDAATQTITWEIKYNYNEKNIAKNDAILKDLFNGSQELLEDSFKVEEVTIDGNGKEVGWNKIDSGYTITPISEAGKNG